ncbi:MAG: hypothetical protein Q8T13_18040 [Acidobacteriota bacterium]|nr:hypothetical protein [Acidobacteriota bacterium]
MKAILGLGVVVIALAMAGCTQPAAPASKNPLSNTFETPEALAQAVLDRLARRDVDGLKALALSEQEFKDHVWPELDTSRPERNVPFEYAWGQLKQRSDGYLDTTVGRYAGQKLRFVSTKYTGEATKYETFSVMRESEIVAADDTGRELVLRLFGSAMVKDGRYKLFSFVVDD